MRKEFLLRHEYFGSLAYSRKSHGYYSFDYVSTEIFNLAEKGREDEILKRAWPCSPEELRDFLSGLKSVGLMDENLKLNGSFCEDHSIPGHLSSPVRVYWGVTYDCNASCKHCSAGPGIKHLPELSLSEMKAIVDELHSLGVCQITLGGGEPLLRPDLLPLIEYMREKDIEVELTTNGFLINTGLAKSLNSLKLRHVDVSFDGGTEKTFDFIRGAGSFQKSFRGLKILCKEMDCPVEMHITGMKPNITESSLLVDIAAGAGCHGIGYLKLRPVGRVKCFPELLISPLEYIETIKELEELCIKKGISPPGDHHRVELPGKDLFVNFGCVGGNTTCWIDPLGLVAPCSYYQYMDKKYIAGNLRENSFKDIWNYSPVFKEIRNLAGNSKCLKCRYINTCRAGCRVLGKIYYNDINAPDPYCAIKPDEEIFKTFITKNQI